MNILYLIVILIAIIFGYVYLKIRFRRKTRKGYGIKVDSNDGRMLDSKQEKQVADYFDKEGLRWDHGESIKVDYVKYELLSKLTFGLIQPKEVTDYIKTDFVLPYEEGKVYIEYFGMINVKGKTGNNYRKRHKEKLKLYKIGNLKLVSLYPEDLDTIDKTFPDKLKEEAGIKIKQIKKSQKDLVFCNECGNQLPKGSKFCDGCGNNLS